MRRTKEEAAQTRAALLDAAEQLFAERGVSRTSLADIAAAAGVTRGAVYWHFRNKSELLDAINSEMLLRYHTDRLPKPGQDWVTFTLANARSIRKTLLAVRDGAGSILIRS